MEGVYVRRDVWTLEPGFEGGPWDEHLLAYARAVRVMKAGDPEDPLSFAGQASAYLGRPRGTWFLLPWVRMHLWYFERIIRAIVAETGGPRDWALPFWGYADAGPPASGAPAAATLPPAFAARELPDGTENPLYRPDGERAAFLNAGEPLPAAVTSAARALAAPSFSPGLGGPPGGPGRGIDPPTPGALEAQPLDSVTAALGLDAALDPVFPLHLAAVDRLWEVWLAQGEGRENPAHFDWANQWFSFCDADGRRRSLTCGQAGDLANLDYAYADVPARAGTARVISEGADAGPVTGSGVERRIAAAPSGGVELGAEPRTVPLRPAAEEPAGDREAGEAEGRLYLHLECARAGTGGASSVWEVRVEGGRTRLADPSWDAVGTIAFTGRDDDARRFVFDVTDAVDDVEPWADRALAVSFHPALPAGREALSARVGSVFLTHG
jgi:tyrosinase-like protein